jgi:hypothetical protein
MKLKESKLTLPNYGITASVGYDHTDVSLEQWYDAFKGCLVGVGFTEEQLENFILELAESISDVRESHCPPFEGEKQSFKDVDKDALAEAYLNRDSILIKQDEMEVDLMIEAAKRRESNFIVEVFLKHTDFWKQHVPDFSFEETPWPEYALNSNEKWYRLLGGKHVYREMPIEMFERRYYNPWKQSQQPIEMSEDDKKDISEHLLQIEESWNRVMGEDKPSLDVSNQ